MNQIYMCPYSILIFEPNIFVCVFGFNFWAEYIRIRIRFLFLNRIYSYSYSVYISKPNSIRTLRGILKINIHFYAEEIDYTKHIFFLKAIINTSFYSNEIITDDDDDFLNANISLGRKKSLSMFALSNVSSIFLSERMHSHTGYIF